MKQKIAKIVFILSFLLTQFFGLVNFAYAQTSCNVPASGIFWADLTNNPVSSIALNGTYKLVATWNNCQNYTGSIIENGPQFGGRTVGIGVLSATNANDQHADTVTITQCGSYYFQPAINNFGSASALGTSNTLTIPCTSTNNNSSCTTGQISQNGSCVTPSDFSCTASSTNIPVGMKCVVGDGQFEQPCTSSSQCVFDGESCNQQGYCTTGGIPSNTSAGAGGTTAGTGGTNGATAATVPLFNPLPEQDLTHVFLLITQGLLAILGIFAVVFIIVGGVEMVVAAGNEEALAKAKKTIVWAVLGLVVALMSFSIIAIVEDLLQANIPSSATTPANPTTGTTPSNPTTGQTPGN